MGKCRATVSLVGTTLNLAGICQVKSYSETIGGPPWTTRVPDHLAVLAIEQVTATNQQAAYKYDAERHNSCKSFIVHFFFTYREHLSHTSVDVAICCGDLNRLSGSAAATRGAR